MSAGVVCETPRMHYQAVLFDFSDTLFHTDHAPRILDLIEPNAKVDLAVVE